MSPTESDARPLSVSQPEILTPKWVWFLIVAIAALLVAGWWLGRQDSAKKELPTEDRELLQNILANGYDTAGRAEGDRLLAEYPRDPFALKTTAAFYYNSGKYPYNRSFLERAEEFLEQYLEKEPSDKESLHTLIQIKLLLLKYKEGITLVEETIRKFPEYSDDFWYDLGRLHDQNGDREKARRFYELALKSNPQDTNVYIFLSRLSMGSLDIPADISSMRSHAQKALERNQSSLKSRDQALAETLLAQSYLLEDNPQRALTHARQAIELNPFCAQCLQVTGETLIAKYKKDTIQKKTKASKDELSEGINILEESLELDSLLSRAYLNLGIGYWLSGEKEKASAAWKKGLEILPAQPHDPAWYKPVIKKELEEALANATPLNLYEP